ncbi:MAG: hypothetical protein EBQ92_07050 [Proteobacteria bacterium]|nr:hypothetical protein [Pseudomonadota bacterium]
MPNSMTSDQKLAATLLHQPLSVMASAGSGKTTTMVERYLTLLKAGFSPRNILTVTFTKEAAEQLRERIIERLLEERLDSKWQDEVENSRTIGTLHSLCYSILNQYGSELGLSPVTQIVDSFAFSTAFLKHYNDWLARISPESLNRLLDHFNHRELKEMTEAVYRHRYLFFECIQLAQDAGAKDIGAKVILLLGSELNIFCEALSSHFHKQGHYSFDDLEHLALRILKESMIARTRLSEDFQQILVDEFQDTSPLQWQILTLLLGDNLNKLFIVGDPKQSIYGFRQAEPALFDEVTQLMNCRGGQKIELSHNFRSDHSLLKEFNSISSSLFSHQSFSWSPMIPGLRPSQETHSAPNPFSVRFFGPKEKTQRQDIYNEEAETVCIHIEQALSSGIPPGMITLLFRNSDRITDFSEKFSKRGWAHQCQKTDNLSKQISALEIVSFLKFLSDPTQDGHFVTLLRSVYLNWSYDQVLSLTQRRLKDVSGKSEPLIHLIRRSPPPDLLWLIKLIDSGQTEVTQCLEALFFETKAFPKNPQAFEALLTPLAKPGLHLFDIQALLDSFQDSDFLFQEKNSLSDKDGGIQLMTVHASKGLEFDHVFLVDTVRQLPQDSPGLLLKAGLPPGIRYWDQDKKVYSSSYQSLLDERRLKDEEESKRVLYVALTRARKSLTVFLPYETALSYPRNSWATLLTEAGVGERTREGTSHRAPSPSQIDLT